MISVYYLYSYSKYVTTHIMQTGIVCVFPIIFKTYLFSESNSSYTSIKLETGISSVWRVHYDTIPSEVVFLGQRESNSVILDFFAFDTISVCEVEAIGKNFLYKFWYYKTIKMLSG